VALMAVGGLALGAAEILRAPARPGVDALGPLAAALAPVVLSTGLPLAALVGLVAGLGQLREEREWLAIRAAGWGGRGLLPGLLVLAALTAAASYALAHEAEPRARTALRKILREGLRPAPGRVVEVGGAVLVVDAVEGDAMRGVIFAWPDAEGRLIVGAAAGGAVADRSLELREGALHRPGQTALKLGFDEATLPLPGPGVRVELVERGDAALEGLVARMEAKGKNAGYERAILEKRSAAPAGAAMMLLLAAPLALRGRGASVAAAVLAYWAAVRGFDHVAMRVGGVVSAWGPPALAAAAAAIAWLTWRDR